MRNLKKILALVLALMMVLSVMVTASAASFTDADEINADYTEAVEVLSAIGVIDGFKNADGSYDFRPEGTLTRAQAAKIISYIHTGDPAAIEETADAIDLPFTDVPAWAEPYVAYCYSEEIIVGRNATTYDPNGVLTGYEFGKMLLIAAGLAYNSDFADTVYTVNGVEYTNPNLAALAASTTGATIETKTTAHSDWKVTVASKLKDNGLWAGAAYDFSLAKQLTREEACYLAYNAIMYYPGSKTLADSLYGANFGGQVETVWIEKNAAVETDCVTIAGELTTGYVYNTVTGAIDSTAFSVYAETGLDMIGHVANVYYYTDRYTSYDIAYTVVDKSNVVELGSYDLFGATTAQAAAKLGIYSSQVAATTYAMAEYDQADNAAAETSGQSTALFNAYGSYWIVPAGTYIVYGGKIVSYMTETTTVEKLVVTVDDAVKGYYTVGDGSDADKYVKVNTNTVGNLNYDMLVTDEAIDWLGLFTDATYRQSATASVLYVVAQYGDYYQLSPVETVTGKVTKLNTAGTWTNNSSKGIYVDGVQYAYDDAGVDAADALIAAPGAAAIGSAGSINFTSTYTFYLDGYGTIFAYTTAGADVVDQNMVFPVTVYSVATNPVYNDYGAVVVPAGNTYWMQAVTMDGTEVLLQLTDETFAGYLTAATPGTATSTTAGTYYTVSGSGASTAVSVKNVAVGDTIASGDKVVDTSAAALNKLYTYVVSYNSTLKANIATLTAVDSIGTDLADSGAVSTSWTSGDKNVTDGASKYYVNDTYTVMYVSGATTTLKTVQVAANNQLLTAGTVVYGVAQNATEASNGNYDLKYVVIRGSAPDAAGSGIIYATGAFTTNNAVPYTNALGATATAYEQKVYIDGVATTILTLGVNDEASTAVAAGCYTYTVDAQGIYHLTAYAYDVAITDIDSIYNGMITDATTSTSDLDVTGVKVVNLISAYSDPTDYAATASITSGEQLYAGCDIVIVYQWNGVAMVPALIYLTNVN